MSSFSMLPAPIVDNCPDCPYRAEGGRAIGNRGAVRSPLVLVGEAPGETEIDCGRPFVGPAGDRLPDAMRDAGLPEDHAFITNAVACRPRPVRPRRSAIRACRGRLIGELARASRTVIIDLGGTALHSLTGRYDLRITRERGHSFDTEWGPVLPTLHPARVLRVRSEYPLLVEDLRRAALRLAGQTQ
jgi:uracil-DNA glycosylase family 4